MKKILSILIIVYMQIPINAFSAADYVPQTCDDMPDKSTYAICLIAKKFQAPLYETFATFFLADIESTAFFCHFRTNLRFQNAKKRLE